VTLFFIPQIAQSITNYCQNQSLTTNWLFSSGTVLEAMVWSEVFAIGVRGYDGDLGLAEAGCRHKNGDKRDASSTIAVFIFYPVMARIRWDQIRV
jgi:hypothetical protein